MSIASTVQEQMSFGEDDHPAIEAPDRRPLSFGALRSLIDETVASLNAFGVGRGDRVAIVLPNGPEMAAAFVAIAAGAVAAPLNPAYRRGIRVLYVGSRRQGAGRRGGRGQRGHRAGAQTRRRDRRIAAASRTRRRRVRLGLLRRPSGRAPARAGDAGGCRADPAHLGDDLTAQDRSALAPQCQRVGVQRRRDVRVCAVGSRPQHHAVVSHSRADCGPARAAFARRRRVLHARLQRAEILRLDA